MITVKCTRCLATADGSDMVDARSKINHAPGLARGIPCGDNFNQVFEIISDNQTVKTDSSSYKKVEAKSAEKIKLDESKTPKSKSVKE